MPTFQIAGWGTSSGRKRKRTVRAIDESAARTMMEAEGTTVEDCVEQPAPPASPALRHLVASLGVTLPDDSSHPECVFEVLRWCIVHRRHVTIQHLTDVDDQPWFARIEPHGFRRSREGHRARCYLPERDDPPDVLMDFQLPGWHLYLVEDIAEIHVEETVFEPRVHRRDDTLDVSLTIAFRTVTAVVV